MTIPALFTLAVIVALVVALVRELARADLAVLGALAVLLLAGIVPPEEAFSGFSNPAVITIAALYVVAAGVHQTGVLSSLDRLFVPNSVRLPGLLLRVMAPTAVASAFLNNTPVVAMLIPRLQDVARRTGIPVSKLLIPLSYAAIVGGMTTLIGTSTNLVASGLLREAGHEGFSMFEFAWIGLPAAAFALLYLALVGHRLLPSGSANEVVEADDARMYQFDLRVPLHSRLAGHSVAEAGLRALQDAYLLHVQREGRVSGPATPEEVLQTGDILTFSGQPDAMERLLQQTDLERAVNGLPRRDALDELPNFEAVVSASSSLVGRTLKETGFRDRYQGVVFAIHRRGEQMRGALGNIPLKPGDLLLIEARPGFDRRWNRGHGDFYLVAPRRRIAERLSRKAPLALLILASMVLLNVIGVLPLATAAVAAALAMVVSGILRGTELRRSVDLSVMLTIAAAFGLGRAVEISGLAGIVGHGIVTLTPDMGPIAVLAALFIVTVLLTEIITNSAAVVLMIPIAIAAAADLGIDEHALALTVTIAASASFLSPLGYQTNLMVMGAGGYQMKDYLRVGLPLSLGVLVITVLVIWLRF